MAAKETGLYANLPNDCLDPEGRDSGTVGSWSLVFHVEPAVPDIMIEDEQAAVLTNGATITWPAMLIGSTASRVLTIQNTGDTNLTGLAVSIEGSGDFSAGVPGATVLGPSAETAFTVTFTPSGTTLCTAVIRVASNDPDESPFVIGLVGTGRGPTLAEWAVEHGLSGPDADPMATPLGDGVPNLLKFAFNMDPTVAGRGELVPGAGTSGLPSIQLVGTGDSARLVIEYVRRRNADLTYEAQFSSTLLPNLWQPATNPEQVTPIDVDWDRVRVEDSVAVGIQPSRFGRVGVILNGD